MEAAATLDRVRKAIAHDLFDGDIDMVQPDDTLDALGASSLDLTSCIYEIEQEFKEELAAGKGLDAIYIGLRDARTDMTVEEVARLVQEAIT